jgi:hypothetical protein
MHVGWMKVLHLGVKAGCGIWSPWSGGAPTMGESRFFFTPKPSLAKGGLGVFVGQAKSGKGHVLAGHGRAGREAGVVAVPACGAVCGCGVGVLWA